MKHFNINEFESPDLKGSGQYMKSEFLDMLDSARELAGIPFVITSGYRTPEHNKNVGGVSSSSHLKGWAADISCIDSVSRHKIITSLLRSGFNRIGVGKTFIHTDCDPTKPKNVIWTY